MPKHGDNMDCTMNFVPRMDIHELLGGYQKVLNTIYSQKYYCERIKTFLANYQYGNPARTKIRVSGLKAFLRSMWRIGMMEKDKYYYWMLIAWSLKDPRRLPLVVRLSIVGYHFREMLKTLSPQMQDLAAVSNRAEGAGQELLVGVVE